VRYTDYKPTDSGPEEYKNVPICLQLVGEAQNDEEFANVAVQVDSVLKPKDTGA
jgi:Asp-tRNA(Asn)/Glu-tRNA(Gln) amidotransferase A subunit family amidase